MINTTTCFHSSIICFCEISTWEYLCPVNGQLSVAAGKVHPQEEALLLGETFGSD